MKQEDKELLLKDLCARLPYNPLISINGERYRMEEIRNAIIGINVYKITVDGCDIEYMNIKPYLFPLSSMSNEQKLEIKSLCDGTEIFDDGSWMSYISILGNFNFEINLAVVDWFNKNHFDYRGLIPKGLAIDATGKGIY